MADNDAPPPVRDFLATDAGEWAVVNGDFAFAAGEQAVPQGIRIRLGFILGECFIDESKGVDYRGQIIGIKNPDPVVVRELLTEQIATTPDVTDVVGAQPLLNSKTREASITYEVATVYSVGGPSLQGQVSVPQ